MLVTALNSLPQISVNNNMTNVLVDSLSCLVNKYYDDLKEGGVECRLVIPAPTNKIATMLQAKLMGISLPSYLVVPHSILPNEELRWIRAEAVTSVRQGDMIIVVWPGEMSRIQDSVIGAGGAIRNFAFGDEWPWIDNGNEYFRFIGPVTQELYRGWKIAPTNTDAFSVILDASMRDCQDSLLRGSVFLDQFIGEFNPALTPLIPNQVESLLFQLGIPAHPDVVWTDVNSVRRYFDEVRRVTASLVDRVRVLGGKQELLDRVEEICANPDEARVMASALGAMIDRISVGGDTVQVGLLTLYGSWTSEAAWQSLRLSILRNILNIAPPDESVVLEVALSALSGAVAADNRAVVLLEGGLISVSGKYAGISASASGAELIIRDRASSPYLRQACTVSGEFEFDLAYEELFGVGSARKKIIKVVIARGADELVTVRIPIFRCDASHPFVVFFEPFSKVLAGRDSGAEVADSDEAEIIEVKEATNVSIVVWDPSTLPVVEIDDAEVDVLAVPFNPIMFSLRDLIDPGLDGSGRTRLNLRSGIYQLAIDFEAKDIVRGEFTLERELMVRLSEMHESPSRPAIKKLVDIFSGANSTPFLGLGGIDDLSRSRINFAKAFENDDTGRPLITDIFHHGVVGESHGSPLVQCQLEALPNAFRGKVVSSQVSELLNAYAAARMALKSALTGLHPTHSPWPIYALQPVFVDGRQEQIGALLCTYLKSYQEILTYAGSATNLTWIERFRLTCSDCVVHWDDKNEGQRLILIGPWHPIVLTKRYMVQSALFKAALRHSSRTDNERNHVLVRLLDQVNSVRWFALPSADGLTYESFYACASSDPGWLVAFQHAMVGTTTYAEFVRALRQLHGLETNLILAGGDNIARTYLQDFFNAYPTRRAISVLADSSYSTAQLVSSATSLLFEGEMPTNVGRQLSGGIHLGVATNDELSTLEWRKPVICVYHVKKEDQSADDFSDIELVSPGRAETTKDRDHNIPLPRGSGKMAAFMSPLKEVGELSSGELTSRAFERDRARICGEENMGTLFSNICRQLANLPDEDLAMNWKASIPADLARLWTVVPGNHIDPAVFVSYVSTAAKHGKNAALWDYSMSLTGTLNSYFVLSQIPKSISHELNKSPVLSGKPLAPAVLGELARVGMALGSESLRSGSKALGVIGVVAAVRLFFPDSSPVSPIRNSGQLRGFLLPVDSFRDVLGEVLDGPESGQRQRADLLAIQLGLIGDGEVAISCSAIECKYTSGVLDHDQILGAMHQAASTLRRIENLITAAQQDDGVPERLALVALVSFGLRLSLEQTIGSAEDRMTVDGQILQRILDGRMSKISSKGAKVVVVTECGARRPGWAQSDGLVIRVCEGSWPGVSESKELAQVRERAAQEFETLFALVNNTNFVCEPSTLGSEVADSTHVEITVAKILESTQQPGGQTPASMLTSPVLSETMPVNNTWSSLKPIMLGSADGLPIYFDPQHPARPLDNNNIMVTGSSGKGKTQFIKAFSAYLRQQNRNLLMIDFKNDFAGDTYFVQSLGLKCSHVSFDGLPFNPLIPVPLRKPNSDVEYISISEHVNGLVDIFRKTFGLGDQQEVAVKNAIRDCFEERGIPPRGTVRYDSTLVFPDFNDVGDRLCESNPQAYNRLDPLFDLGIFPSSARHIRFDAVLEYSSIIDISQIQNDRIKNAVAKMMVISAHRYYNARPHSGILKQFFIFDEAHRILDTEFVLQFVRECRAYGVGVLLSSQYPSDFPQDISSSLNTKVIHGNGPERDRVREIGRTVGNSIPEDQIAGLGMFQAIIANPQYAGVQMNTISYPMLLVLLALGEGIHPVEQLVVPGLDATRLSISHLVDLLARMGLVELVSGGCRRRLI